MTITDPIVHAAENGKYFPDPLLCDKQGAAILGCSVATFWRRVADQTIEPPLKIGGTSRWPQSEILAVIERAKANRAAA